MDQYWGPITNLLAMVIKSYGNDKGQTTRVLAYSVLDTLLQISEGRHPPAAALLSRVIKDITPRAHQVKLQVGHIQVFLCFIVFCVEKRNFLGILYKVTDACNI